MPITYSSRRSSGERQYQIFMDWTRRIMQLAALATIILYAYLFYGLLLGDVGHWSALSAADKVRIAGNVEGAVFWLSVALGLLLLTMCILYYDEESFGYTLVGAAVFLYYGLPFLFNMLMSGQLEDWQKTKNVAALAIYNQLRLAGLMLGVPGVVLTVRDLILRLVDGSQRKRNEFSAMQYGGSVKEEAPVGIAPIGMLAKCWQLPFCRDAIRRRCPIYHARTRCWRERVGCMCEENVIRNAMDAVINKELITFDKALDGESAIKGMDDPLAAKGDVATVEKTEEIQRPEYVPPVSPKHVKIPHNPNLSMKLKVERCRNCVIYNEHQRLKYQFFAPVFVLAVPAIAYFNIDKLLQGLDNLLHTIDRAMERLSPVANPHPIGISGLTSTNDVAKFVIVGCMIVVVTSMALRLLEYCVFKLKM